LTDSGLTDFDLYLFGEGKHERIYDKLGAHAHNRQSWVSAAPEGAQGYLYSLRLNRPPLGAIFVVGPA
jgi:1,4-alpha-glucan branching enzyme